MIPLRDNIPSRTRPGIGLLIILACTLVFALQAFYPAGPRGDLAEQYGMIPRRVIDPDRPVVVKEQRLVRTPLGPVEHTVSRPLPPPPIPPLWTMLTCIFLHGGVLHILGNMWFLYVFGDNVEDRFGHGKFLLFYLFCGLAGSVFHLVTNPGSTVPTIGASGAIAGVMGAYFVLYPQARVLTLIPIFLFFPIVDIPAPVFLGVWFLFQFAQGLVPVSGAAGGVAWWAHIGGFAAGVAIALALRNSPYLRPPVRHRLHGRDALRW